VLNECLVAKRSYGRQSMRAEERSSRRLADRRAAAIRRGLATTPSATNIDRRASAVCAPIGADRFATITTMPTKAELLAKLNSGLADEHAQALRQRIAKEIPQRLAENAQRLSFHHNFPAPAAAGIGFATAAAIAAELGAGAGQLFTTGYTYAGAALVRQLIECNYLLALMAENRAESEAWMQASHAEIVKTFMPRQMRKRSVQSFRVNEYHVHCDRGGHPNPAGRDLLGRLVPDPRELTLHANSRWLDLSEHLADVWASFVDGLPLYDPRQDSTSPLYNPDRSPDGGPAIEALLLEWQQDDLIARSMPAGPAISLP
jgi:hypothetical protein